MEREERGRWSSGTVEEVLKSLFFLFFLVFPCVFLVFRPSVFGFFVFFGFSLCFFGFHRRHQKSMCNPPTKRTPPPPQKESLCRGRELRMTEETDEETKEEEDDDDDEAEDDDETSRKHAWILEPG